MHLLLGSHSRPWVQAEQAFGQVLSSRRGARSAQQKGQSRTSPMDVGAGPTGIYQTPVGPVWECPLRSECCGNCRALAV